MGGVARFMHVSLRRFQTDWREVFGDVAVPALPALPRRATSGSAGYDFFSPLAFTLAPGACIRIPTGVRARIDDGWVLMLFPRSGLGFKYRLQLDNTVGIIDADYYHALNEGHIMIKVTNNGSKQLSLRKGDRFAQGIFIPYGITEDDEASEERTGGFGSTNKQ